MATIGGPPRRRSSSGPIILVIAMGALLFGTSLLMLSVITPKGHAASDDAATTVVDGAPSTTDPLDEILEPPIASDGDKDESLGWRLRQRIIGSGLKRKADRRAQRQDSWDAAKESDSRPIADVWGSESDDNSFEEPPQRKGAGNRALEASGDAAAMDNKSEAIAKHREATQLARMQAQVKQLEAKLRKAEEELRASKSAALAALSQRQGSAASNENADKCPPAQAAVGNSGGGTSGRALLSRPRPKAYVPSSNGRSLLAAWRARQIDWHDLVRPVKPMSDADAASEYRNKLLVGQELDAISYLQGFLGLRGFVSGGAALMSSSSSPVSDPYDVSAHYAPSSDWGPMAKYGACPVIRDKCMVHGSDRECVLDELCGWCAGRQLCVDRLVKSRPELVTGEPAPVCEQPLLVLKSSADAQAGRIASDVLGTLSVLSPYGDLNGQPTGGVSDCSLIVTRNRAVKVGVTGNAKMAYHFFTENAQGIHLDFANNGAVSDLASHVWVPPDSTPEFHELLHGYTDSCFRWTYEIPAASDATICYSGSKLHKDDDDVEVALWDVQTRSPVSGDAAWGSHPSLAAYVAAGGGAAGGKKRLARTSEEASIALGHRVGIDGLVRWLNKEGGASASEEAAAVTAMGAKGMPDFLIAALGLWDVKPTVPHVTLLSRRNKRLILNEPELVREVLSIGGSPKPVIEVASLETMTLYEQLALFRRTTVLAGIHGSGLINSIFMHPGTALVQLMPYKVSSGSSFFAGPASGGGVSYFEWTNPKKENSVHHFHFLGRDYAGKTDELVDCGSNCGGPDIYFSFHINQVS